MSSSVAAGGLSSRLNWAAGPWAKVSWKFLVVGIILALALPWVLNTLTTGRFIMHMIILFFGWGIVVQAWNLIMGVSGIFSLAQVALFYVGGLTSGVLALHLGWSPWVSMWVAPIAAVIAAMIIGLPTLRLRGTYIVLLTLAFHELVRNLAIQGPAWMAGGGYGLRYVPKFGFEEWLPRDIDQIMYYYVGLVLFGITTYAIWRVLNSPIGLSFRALRDSESYAISRGVDPYRFKLFLFAFSAFFTGLAGAYFTHYSGALSPAILSFGTIINLLAMIVIGGWGSMWGPIFGTALLTVLPEVLRAAEAYRTLILGMLLALIAVFAPEGLGPLIGKGISKIAGRFRKEKPEEAEAAS